MKMYELILEANQPIVDGTNCANCKFVNPKGVKVSKDELNEQGGIEITDPKKIKLAQTADLLTMPGKKLPKKKHYCGHPKISMFVSERQCCGFWSNTGALRQFKMTIDK